MIEQLNANPQLTVCDVDALDKLRQWGITKDTLRKHVSSLQGKASTAVGRGPPPAEGAPVNSGAKTADATGAGTQSPAGSRNYPNTPFTSPSAVYGQAVVSADPGWVVRYNPDAGDAFPVCPGHVGFLAQYDPTRRKEDDDQDTDEEDDVTDHDEYICLHVDAPENLNDDEYAIEKKGAQLKIEWPMKESLALPRTAAKGLPNAYCYHMKYHPRRTAMEKALMQKMEDATDRPVHTIRFDLCKQVELKLPMLPGRKNPHLHPYKIYERDANGNFVRDSKGDKIEKGIEHALIFQLKIVKEKIFQSKSEKYVKQAKMPGTVIYALSLMVVSDNTSEDMEDTEDVTPSDETNSIGSFWTSALALSTQAKTSLQRAIEAPKTSRKASEVEMLQTGAGKKAKTDDYKPMDGVTGPPDDGEIF